MGASSITNTIIAALALFVAFKITASITNKFTGGMMQGGLKGIKGNLEFAKGALQNTMEAVNSGKPGEAIKNTFMDKKDVDNEQKKAQQEQEAREQERAERREQALRDMEKKNNDDEELNVNANDGADKIADSIDNTNEAIDNASEEKPALPAISEENQELLEGQGIDTKGADKEIKEVDLDASELGRAMQEAVASSEASSELSEDERQRSIESLNNAAEASSQQVDMDQMDEATTAQMFARYESEMAGDFDNDGPTLGGNVNDIKEATREQNEILRSIGNLTINIEDLMNEQSDPVVTMGDIGDKIGKIPGLKKKK